MSVLLIDPDSTESAPSMTAVDGGRCLDLVLQLRAGWYPPENQPTADLHASQEDR